MGQRTKPSWLLLFSSTSVKVSFFFFLTLVLSVNSLKQSLRQCEKSAREPSSASRFHKGTVLSLHLLTMNGCQSLWAGCWDWALSHCTLFTGVMGEGLPYSNFNGPKVQLLRPLRNTPPKYCILSWVQLIFWLPVSYKNALGASFLLCKITALTFPFFSNTWQTIGVSSRRLLLICIYSMKMF